MGLLAATYYGQGRHDEAEEIKVEMLELSREVLGEKHPNTLQAMYDLAFTWKSRGRGDDAAVLLGECLQLRRSKLGPDHPFTKQTGKLLEEWG